MRLFPYFFHTVTESFRISVQRVIALPADYQRKPSPSLSSVSSETERILMISPVFTAGDVIFRVLTSRKHPSKTQFLITLISMVHISNAHPSTERHFLGL